MKYSTALQCAAAALLIFVTAFFVASESALVRARRSRLSNLARAGDRLARAAERAQAELDRSVAGARFGAAIASLGLGWLGEPLLAGAVEDVLGGLSIAAPATAVHAIAIALAFLLLVYLHAVLGRLVPDALALRKPDESARYLAGPLVLFLRVAFPLIWASQRSARALLHVLSLAETSADVRAESSEDLRIRFQESLRGGGMEEDEEAMIHGVFELTRTVAREVMTPRTDIVAVEAGAGLEDVLQIAARSGLSRLPVYEESIDQVIGVLLVKDLLPWLLRDDRDTVVARDLVRDAIFVPDTKPVDDLLAELRHQKVHMAIVVDEFGGTDGIVTLEDLVEEIVGEIYDEHDVARPELTVQADGRVLLDGGLSFSDLLERFRLPAPEDEYDTVAGYVIGKLGRIPDVGERVRLGPGELEVAAIHDRRITRLELRLPPQPEGVGERRGGREAD
ncbi:MAG: hemolysin family protein [Gemmatimonadota bacterium]